MPFELFYISGFDRSYGLDWIEKIEPTSNSGVNHSPPFTVYYMYAQA